ncbi:MAG: type II toxin-antitoxin system VapC family toxin [Thermoplasmata archaeon]|nr:type II toxin-antitoxin system VapC family toxin [Thermoplasmata archaeon]
MTDSDRAPAHPICIDSYGWIERFMGGPKAPDYNRVIDRVDVQAIITSVVVLCEVYKRVKGALGEETALRDVAALDRTRVVAIDRDIALEAADFSLAHRLHLSDAQILATARRFGAELYTSDAALAGLPGVTTI